MATEDQSEETKEMEVMEQKKISLMRAFVESQDPTSKDVDDLMIRRFLRARGHDIEQGSALFLKYLKWRRSFVPNGLISESEITSNLAHKKVFLQGLDKRGRPIIVSFGSKHLPKKEKGGVEEFKQFPLSEAVFPDDYRFCGIHSRQNMCEDARRTRKVCRHQDMEGWGYYSNSDTRGCLAALTYRFEQLTYRIQPNIIWDNYPERLGKMYLVHVSSVFMAAWKLVYPFIDSSTKKKIVFVENKKLKSTLLEHIDESQLPEIYGGKQPLVPIEES
ncbi:hypothetical protein C5167_022137 [Papaver somniferum]|uniref:CRAL-TRIO domain-containing protein n=1 Tax=Papaver somniferum TaxID=3469 RepID=A0A4Y7JHY7_PAPSO|nr:hypothetical protein C5167_022137 [Papaver somniferum]